jgi:DNA-binding transcriptional ArsR family regulator
VENRAERRVRISDPKVMRALAHPARVAILEEMSAGREGTATEFAAVCGLTPSATSYHLRALARAGLVQEAPGRGDGRERVWRSPGSGYALAVDLDDDPESELAYREVIGALLDRQDVRARAWLAGVAQESQEWQETATLIDSILLVAPDEMKALNTRVNELLAPYRARDRRDGGPAGARAVAVTYRAVPLSPPPSAD